MGVTRLFRETKENELFNATNINSCVDYIMTPFNTHEHIKLVIEAIADIASIKNQII